MPPLMKGDVVGKASSSVFITRPRFDRSIVSLLVLFYLVFIQMYPTHSLEEKSSGRMEKHGA